MGFLAAQGAILAIGIIISVICTVIGLFFGHIILFDSIALGIVDLESEALAQRSHRNRQIEDRSIGGQSAFTARERELAG